MLLPPALAVEELRRHRLKQAEELLRLGIRQSDETHVCLFNPTISLGRREPCRAPLCGLSKHPACRGCACTICVILTQHLLAANVHPKIVQERLGHANIGITMDIYSHVMPGMQDEAASRVDAVLRAALAKRRDG